MFLLYTSTYRYSPLGDNGKHFLSALDEFVSTRSSITGDELSTKINELETKYSPIFSSASFIGCKPSGKGKRGYSCGLWTLFHYLTVQAELTAATSDPLDALHAIHGYVKYFFGCTHCSEHFQQMAKRNRLWDVDSFEGAILWLWSAHNEVNRRLAGDATEDAEFPKNQYPVEQICKRCYVKVTDGLTKWDHNEVLYFMRHTYALGNLNRFGVDDESILPVRAELLPAQLTSNAASNSGSFSELDIRMGILLYAFCMIIIVVAVKMLLQRGYRKKLYAHDTLGKI